MKENKTAMSLISFHFTFIRIESLCRFVVELIGRVSLESDLRSSLREFGGDGGGGGGGRGSTETFLQQWLVIEPMMSLAPPIYETVKWTVISAPTGTDTNYRLWMVCPIHRSVFSLLISGYVTTLLKVSTVYFVYTRFKLIGSLKRKAEEITYKSMASH